MLRVTACLLAALLIPPAAPAQAPRQPVPSRDRAWLDQYCVTCHSETQKVAGLMLDKIDPSKISVADAEVWEIVLRRLRTGSMPPQGLPRPDDTALEGFVSSLEAALDRDNPAIKDPSPARRIDDLELASRLAMFLWRSSPDEELLAVARLGQLKSPSMLEQQVRRMLDDPRSNALITNFFSSWLYLGNVRSLKPDPAVFPEFDEDLRMAFTQETQLFLESQLREDRPVPELLSANYAFINDRLARHYGIPNVSGREFRRITFSDDRRAGLLGQGAILAVTSYAHRTSPVLRGKYVLEVFLGTPPPAPVPNVPALKEDAVNRAATMRQRMEQHRKNPVCASCHSTIDPIGFALEHFDAIGRWRTSIGDVPIDTSGALPDGTTVSDAAGLRAGLLRYHDVIMTSIIQRLLTYGLGREFKSSDMPAVRKILRDSASHGDVWSSLFLSIVQSTPFQTKGS